MGRTTFEILLGIEIWVDADQDKNGNKRSVRDVSLEPDCKIDQTMSAPRISPRAEKDAMWFVQVMQGLAEGVPYPPRNIPAQQITISRQEEPENYYSALQEYLVATYPYEVISRLTRRVKTYGPDDPPSPEDIRQQEMELLRYQADARSVAARLIFLSKL